MKLSPFQEDLGSDPFAVALLERDAEIKRLRKELTAALEELRPYSDAWYRARRALEEKKV